MVPPPESSADGGPDETDGSAIDRVELYHLINTAVEDAILGAIGTIVLVVVSLALVWFGVLVAVSMYDSSGLSAIGGLFVALVGLYLAGSTLELIPTVTELLSG